MEQVLGPEGQPWGPLHPGDRLSAPAVALGSMERVAAGCVQPTAPRKSEGAEELGVRGKIPVRRGQGHGPGQGQGAQDPRTHRGDLPEFGPWHPFSKGPGRDGDSWRRVGPDFHSLVSETRGRVGGGAARNLSFSEGRAQVLRRFLVRMQRTEGAWTQHQNQSGKAPRRDGDTGQDWIRASGCQVARAAEWGARGQNRGKDR